MKFSCTQENLKHGLLIVSRVANKNANLPILQNVLIKAQDNKIVLAATNLEIGVQATLRAKVDTDGSFTLPAQLFSNYVALLTTEKIDCELQQNELRVTANGQATVLKGEGAGDFPILPTVEGGQHYSLVRGDLEVALQQTILAAAIDETRPEIAGICLMFSDKNLKLAATDSYRLAERTAPLTQVGESMKIILPQRSAHELLRLIQFIQIETVDLFVTETQIACRLGEVEFISRLIEGKFPDYEQIIPKAGQTTVSLDKNDLMKAVKGAALFSKTGVNDINLTFNATDQTLQIKAVNTQLGQNVTTLPAQVAGDDVTIVFNYRFLLDGLQCLIGNEVICLLNGQLSPALIKGGSDDLFNYIIMPIKQ
ncbi:MAG: DNA polymerase III subunit beta [Patescibacteria group bacterium]